NGRGRRRRRGRGRQRNGSRERRGDNAPDADAGTEGEEDDAEPSKDGNGEGSVSRRRRKRRRGSVDMELKGGEDGDPEDTVTRVRAPRQASSPAPTTVQGVKGSTRLEAKRQRRRDSRTGGRRRTVITEAEFLARRESVDRKMLVRQRDKRIQIAVLEDGVLAEHFVSHTTQDSLIGNVYLGKVQNVLPSMEAAFVDIGRGRNAVLYAGEVDWDAAQLDGKAKKIENALKSGDTVLVQVTKDPVGHKGARLTSQVSLPGRYLVYVPGGTMTGISRKLPDVERSRLKKVLKDHLPKDAGVIVRTAAEGTSEQELMNDINRLRAQWEGIQEKAASKKVLAPELLYAEPDLTIKTVRDVFNEDFSAMIVQGEATWDNIEAYVMYVAPHLLDRLHHWVPQDHDGEDLYATHRIDEQLHKALERKVYLPSGGSLVIDRTEAMTVVDVNTGKFTGSGGSLEETVTKNNLEAAEEIVRQLRLRDIGGIIVIDFIDMVLESNQDLVLRRMVECLGRDRTKHQVAEVTSLGLVQMTRKRMGTGLVEVFSENCDHCAGRGILIQDEPVDRSRTQHQGGNGHGGQDDSSRRRRKKRGGQNGSSEQETPTPATESGASDESGTEEEQQRQERAAAARAALQSIAKASGKVTEDEYAHDDAGQDGAQRDTERDAEGDQDAQQRGGSSRDGDGNEGSGARSGRRKRRGKRRGRRRGEDQQDQNGQQDQPVQNGQQDQDATQARQGQSRSDRTESESATAQESAEKDNAVITFGDEAVEVPRRRRSRRASSDTAGRDSGPAQGSGAEKLNRLEDALDQRGESPAGESPADAPAPAQSAPQAVPTRRRSRRAASSGGTGSQIETASGSAEQAQGSTFTASSTTAAQAAEPKAAPVMLGVGVKAADIVRHD
ncbi:MAG: Rne/Rng family ribonuclease, partial [Micrococcus sp.]|nr:Rne/Rng family ribonuclease [Micrococcus sp.]